MCRDLPLRKQKGSGVIEILAAGCLCLLPESQVSSTAGILFLRDSFSLKKSFVLLLLFFCFKEISA